MKIAIVGGGFAGLASAWHLLQHPNVQVTLFEANDVGSGASGLATALLHYYPGRHARRSWNADEAMQESLVLLKLSEETLKKKVADYSGILRIAITEQQKSDFFRVTQNDPSTEWWTKEKCQKEVPGVVVEPGLFLRKGISVYTPLYLKGLLQACQSKGLIFLQKEVNSLYELLDFDQIVVAAGAGIFKFPECAHLPIRVTKGQMLVCEGASLPFPVSSQGHITNSSDGKISFLGSTFEHDYTSLDPDEKALCLKEKISLFYPPANDWKVIDSISGARVARNGIYYPMVEKITEKIWVITGLGSRGLLYHALLGKNLSQQMLSLS